MPSPIGHALAGVAAGWIVARPSGNGASAVRDALMFGCLAVLPDFDLLVGAHSGPTHSVGAAIVVACVVWLVRSDPGAGVRRLTFAVACGAAYGSHALLDWLGTDSSPPIGIMALWPFSHGYFESDLHVFMAISRRYYQGWTFVRQNTLAFVLELVILIPFIAAVFLLRRRRPEQGPMN